MIRISRDNSEVYTLLEESGFLFSDFGKDCLLAFSLENDFCLVIYMAKTRSFILYRAEDYVQDRDGLAELIEKLDNSEKASGPVLPEEIYLKALNMIEEEMASTNYRFYFDAH